LEEQAIVKLLEMDIPARTARECVKKALKGQISGQPLGQVIRKAFKLALNMDSQQDIPAEKAEPDQEDLRYAAGENAYDQLKEAGALSDEAEEW
jgi:hypothetical protein